MGFTLCAVPQFGSVQWDNVNSSVFTASSPYIGSENEETLAAYFTADPVAVANGFAPSDAALLVGYFTGETFKWGLRQSKTWRIDVHGLDEDDSAPPTTTGTWDTDHGLATSAHVEEVLRPQWCNTDSTAWATKDLSSIIAEICARAGWASGQAIGLHLDTNTTDAPGATHCHRDWLGAAKLALFDAGEIWPRPIGQMTQQTSGQYLSNDSSAGNSRFTAFDMVYPPDMLVGETILFIMGVSHNATVTWPSGWTGIGQVANGSSCSLHAAWHKVTGNEGEVFRITLDAYEESMIAYAMRITRCADPDVSPPEWATATGTSTTPDPPSISPAAGQKKYLSIAVFTSGASSASVSAWPTNYMRWGGNYVYDYAGTVYQHLYPALYWFDSTSENPGTYTISASRAWVAATILVHPATSVPTYYSTTKDASWGVG